MRRTALSLLVVLALAPLAAGHDLLPPSWRGDPGTSTLLYDNNWLTPDYFNDYGGGLAPPEIHYDSGWDYWDGGMLGMPGYGWYIPWGYRNNRLVFEMDNYDNENLFKDIRVQVTFYAPDWYNWFEPWNLRVWAAADPSNPWIIDDPGWYDGWYDVEYSNWIDVPGYGGWVTAAFDLRLSPNPDSETIGLDFGYWPWWYSSSGFWGYPYGIGNLYIDQVVIDTRCSSVPEPSVLALACFGLLGTVAFGRRR